MPVEYTYDEENKVMYTRFFGLVTEKDLKDQAEAVAADSRIEPGVRELVDLSGVEDIQGGASGLEENIRIDSAHGEKLAGLRTAIVAPTDLLYGFSRMYQSLAELREAPSTIEVFRTVEEAREWLGLKGDEARS
jgi:hypothetical protein